ncbi:hypothetical protein Ddye_003453 [Dipteronia dyeriana]|uniref:Btz domain-containing protein n=1 Tax=Dipteronia dyeriana TaxID=168575 RepID=A0AAD9XSB4_9ROSI|nr:hypothetical protein Ddye_003453 [Dipteronia dyeriana]
MSRRESRDSDSKRHRSRFDREPSPKRSRWDGKPATDRVPGSNNLDSGGNVDQGKTHRRRLQEALPLEAPSAADTKVEAGSLTNESDKKSNGLHEKTKLSSDPAQVPRSRSFFQHDERGAGQVDRSFGRGEATEHDWRSDSRNRKNERTAEKRETYDTRERNEKSEVKRADNEVWHHDEFFKLEANPPPPPARKRRAFREEKGPLDSENANKTAVESVKMNHTDRYALGSGRREDRSRNSHHSDRVEKPSFEDRFLNKGEAEKGGYPYRQRYNGGDYRGRDRFDGRQDYRSSNTGGDKWKHDLFQDGNRSPTLKDEEEEVAKVEALLAS